MRDKMEVLPKRLYFGSFRFLPPESSSLHLFCIDYNSTVNRTHWDKSKRWEMLGPESARNGNGCCRVISAPAHVSVGDCSANTSRFGRV